MALLQLQKRTMALAGLVLAAYLLLHLFSSLTLFSAPHFDAFHEIYNRPWLRWPLRVVVLLALLVHVRAAIVIRLVNHRARRTPYQKQAHLQLPASVVSLSIAFLLLFILVHVGQSLLLDKAHLYQGVVGWFESRTMLVFYLAGLLVLGLHMQHALVNVLQTLGISHRSHRVAVTATVALLVSGYAAAPIYVAGWTT